MAELRAAWVRKSFRVRGLPNHVATLEEAASVLADVFDDLDKTQIHVQSLATSVDHYWVENPPKVATVQFNSVPRILQDKLRTDEWDLTSYSNVEGLLLDSHFVGLTPLNDVDPALHQMDCIAISGLGSHPFGSWQPKGPDKSFMWIRDEVPNLLPQMRAVLYGYNSALLESESYQLIRDIAKALIETLKSGGWLSVLSKPLVFLAHSLGGLVLKDAICQVANNISVGNRGSLNSIKGAIMFGCPNLGMEQSHFLTIVGGRPNETLVEDLARNSNYLTKLDRSFSGIAFQHNFLIFWAYETLQSPTLRATGAGVDRDGPPELLVSQHSATCRSELQKPSNILPIHENHSNMVKYPRRSSYIGTMCHILKQMMQSDTIHASAPENDASMLKNLSRNTHPFGGVSVNDILASLNAPDLDLRRDTIKDQYESTFEWLWRLDPWIDWLKTGEGFFWISGKPGSGKSTLMNFIFRDGRTQGLLDSWVDQSDYYIMAGFFFHKRGSDMQNTFHGFLRSIIRQILQQAPRLIEVFQNDITKPRNTWLLSDLRACLRKLLGQKVCHLKICFFFDALDEYAGHPEEISQFLQDLMTADSYPQTKLKICFSSRPWDTFVQHFGSWPGLTLQEHTKNDILAYCAGMLGKCQLPPDALEELVSKIITRSAGVFLWVQLVVRDLSHEFVNNEANLTKLRALLNSLPDELDTYYQHTLDRMSPSHRWETYALLSLVSTRNFDRRFSDLEYINLAIAVSKCGTYREITQLAVHERAKTKHTTNDSSWKQNITLWGGSLAEVIAKDGVNVIQFMHQTVLDFVTSLSFKEKALGVLAKVTHENAFSLHVKGSLACLTQRLAECRHIGKTQRLSFGVYAAMFVICAKEAELTTGRSQVELLSSIPDPEIRRILGLIRTTVLIPRTRAGFAAYANLLLYMQDMMAMANEWREQVTEPLLRINTATPWFHERPGNEPDMAMALLLLRNGYKLSRREYDCLSWVIDTARRRRDASVEEALAMEHFPEICLLLLDAGSPCDRPIIQLTSGKWTLPLHHANLAIAQKLFQMGADPNGLDYYGCTALDHVLSPQTEMKALHNDLYPFIDLSKQERYHLANYLIEQGGKIRRSWRWTETVDQFDEAGLDTQEMRQCLESSRYSHWENRTATVLWARRRQWSYIWKVPWKYFYRDHMVLKAKLAGQSTALRYLHWEWLIRVATLRGTADL